MPANLKILKEISDVGIAVPIRNPRSLPASRTAELMMEAGFRSVKSFESVTEALETAGSGTLVCGSLFLAGEALEHFGLLTPRVGGPDPNETVRSGAMLHI